MIRESVVRVGGLSFRVRSSDGPEGTSRTFVLIHGIGASHRYLSRLHERLAATGSVHSIDLPGFAGLPKPDHAPDIAETATALGDVLTRLGVERAVLVGHSMGAQWVVELGAQRPELIAAVVVIGPVTDSEHRSAPAQAVALTADVLGETPGANAIVFTDYLRCGPRWYARHLPFMIGYPIEERVAALTAPLLVIRGGNDPVAGIRWCRRLRDSAAEGFVAVVPGHRHVVQHTAPGAVASAIIAHLRP
ncbi:alpha/beta fold hydrolase [Microbacterium sp. P01]|uniref:alpha/beta fold hydrolase n=1 Tax=Microbacterium sp. P01 TaxID=3366261 RepID=UPI00366FA1F6